MAQRTSRPSSPKVIEETRYRTAQFGQSEETLESEYQFQDKGGDADSALDEDIPDGVKPDHANVPAFAEDVLRPKVGLQGKLTGYLAALMIFGFLIIGAFIFRQAIMSSWPASTVIYELAGVSVELKGEALVIETLTAQAQRNTEGHDVLYLQGRVINLTEEAQDVPNLLARLRSTNGEDGDSWNIESPLKVLSPGESFTFKSDYPAVPRGVGSVNLTFVPAI